MIGVQGWLPVTFPGTNAFGEAAVDVIHQFWLSWCLLYQLLSGLRTVTRGTVDVSENMPDFFVQHRVRAVIVRPSLILFHFDCVCVCCVGERGKPGGSFLGAGPDG